MSGMSRRLHAAALIRSDYVLIGMFTGCLVNRTRWRMLDHGRRPPGNRIFQITEPVAARPPAGRCGVRTGAMQDATGKAIRPPVDPPQDGGAPRR